jgi:hypothetical protein
VLPGYDHWKTSPPDDDDEEFPDATDDRDDFEPPEPPEPASYRTPSGRIVYEEDFMYDPLSRAGFE